jgi:hypothetical protein
MRRFVAARLVLFPSSPIPKMALPRRIDALDACAKVF